MASLLPLLLASVGPPTARHGFLTGKRPPMSSPVSDGYPPTPICTESRPFWASSSLNHFTMQKGQVDQSLPELARLIDDLNPSPAGPADANNIVRLDTLLIPFEQFKVWSIQGDLPIQKIEINLFDESPSTDIYLSTPSTSETSYDNEYFDPFTLLPGRRNYGDSLRGCFSEPLPPFSLLFRPDEVR